MEKTTKGLLESLRKKYGYKSGELIYLLEQYSDVKSGKVKFSTILDEIRGVY